MVSALKKMRANRENNEARVGSLLRYLGWQERPLCWGNMIVFAWPAFWIPSTSEPLYRIWGIPYERTGLSAAQACHLSPPNQAYSFRKLQLERSWKDFTFFFFKKICKMEKEMPLSLAMQWWGWWGYQRPNCARPIPVIDCARSGCSLGVKKWQ